jgi:predicted MPP superfamily phosphohydrolase
VRRALALAVVLVILLGLLGAAHYYLALRLVLDPGLAPPGRDWALAALELLGLLVVLHPLVDRAVGPPLARVIAWPAALWMGVAFFLLVFLAASDGVLAVAGRAALAAPEVPVPGAGTARARAFAAVAVAAVGAGFGLYAGLRRPAVRRTELRLARWPAGLDGFRIVQISDLHIGPLLGQRFGADVAARVNALAPDLVAVTGDLVDGTVATLADEVAPLAALRARHGVFFVTGNHDYYSGADAWLAHLGGLGFRALRNERVTIGEGGAVFDLAGVDDRHARLFGGDHGEDVPRALAGRDPARAVVLLAHDPGTFKEAAAHDVDLQLSGHTHGGQLWPFRYLVRLAIPWVAGHHARGASRLYVSRGTGFWGPPMRLFAPAEITEIVLRAVPA